MCGVATAIVGAVAPGSAVAQTDAPPAGEELRALVLSAPAYAVLGARHLYNLYGERIFKGQLPPLLYAIAIVETEIDEEGNVLSAEVTREPASAKDVIPWVLGLIRAASPFPRPEHGRTRYQDIWLVDRTYMFQLHTLTEGQRSGD